MVGVPLPPRASLRVPGECREVRQHAAVRAATGSLMNHSTAKAGLPALHRCALAALMMLAPLAANAADAGYTDRIIVKYRTAPASALAETAQLRGTERPAARMGLAM